MDEGRKRFRDYGRDLGSPIFAERILQRIDAEWPTAR